MAVSIRCISPIAIASLRSGARKKVRPGRALGTARKSREKLAVLETDPDQSVAQTALDVSTHIRVYALSFGVDLRRGAQNVRQSQSSTRADYARSSVSSPVIARQLLASFFLSFFSLMIVNCAIRTYLSAARQFECLFER